MDEKLEKDHRGYNQQIVRDILQNGLTARGESVRLITGSGLEYGEISLVKIPSDETLKTEFKRSGHVGPVSNEQLLELRLNAVRNYVNFGNAAGLLPVVAERSWERFFDEKYDHTNEEWQDRFNASIVIAVRIDNLQIDERLMELNYGEIRVVPPILPEAFAMIFVPEQNLDYFDGASNIQPIKQVHAEVEMNFWDKTNKRRIYDKRQMEIPNYAELIANFINDNGNNYVFHIVRLVTEEDIAHINF